MRERENHRFVVRAIYAFICWCQSAQSASTDLPTLLPIFKFEITAHQDPTCEPSGPTVGQFMRGTGATGEATLPTVSVLEFPGRSCRQELRYKRLLVGGLLTEASVEALFSAPTQLLSTASPSPFPPASASPVCKKSKKAFCSGPLCTERHLSLPAACHCPTRACRLLDCRHLFGFIFLVIGTLKALEKC